MAKLPGGARVPGPARGAAVRRQVLEEAVDLASLEGLDGVTIGWLASELGMSKSGLFRLFGSKEELQVATVDAAAQIFAEAVLAPTATTEPGLERLRAIVEAWLAYNTGDVFPGGCFFYANAPVVDGRPGPVRDAMAAATRNGLELVAAEVRAAQMNGEIVADADPRQVTFELHALIQEANLWHLMHGDSAATDRAVTGVERLLERLQPRG